MMGRRTEGDGEARAPAARGRSTWRLTSGWAPMRLIIVATLRDLCGGKFGGSSPVIGRGRRILLMSKSLLLELASEEAASARNVSCFLRQALSPKMSAASGRLLEALIQCFVSPTCNGSTLRPMLFSNASQELVSLSLTCHNNWLSLSHVYLPCFMTGCQSPVLTCRLA